MNTAPGRLLTTAEERAFRAAWPSRRAPMIADRCLRCGRTFRVPDGEEGTVVCPHCGAPPASIDEREGV